MSGRRPPFTVPSDEAVWARFGELESFVENVEEALEVLSTMLDDAIAVSGDPDDPEWGSRLGWLTANREEWSNVEDQLIFIGSMFQEFDAVPVLAALRRRVWWESDRATPR